MTLELVPMHEDEFQMYLAYSVQQYALEHIRGGRWNEEEALGKAQEEFQHYLSQGLQTPNHYLCMLRDETRAKNVGILWFALEKRGGQSMVFIYDIEIFEEFRRQGYATEALLALEKRANKMDADAIGLHVFGHNLAARTLYEKMGYVATNIQMVKQLEKKTS